MLNDGVLIVLSGTISKNRAQYGGGMIANTGPTPGGESTTLMNTILAGNSAGTGPDCSGGIDAGAGGHNLVGSAAGCAIALHGTAGNLIGSARHRIRAKLGRLHANGGPTNTMALLAGSPALAAGDSSACAAPPVARLDQRGFTRPQPCSIGAWDAGVPLSVSTKP